ncbi:WhiB family transcriptional regulator [Antribacter gilvus]|uniref:WhiB family transcriptional regulator n=1 Tax=Antribacter gilvus TaxID=2304675 RepID=UPI0023E88CE5|nr:WhiB family transcriptional regulator [Antribacter gilvus]
MRLTALLDTLPQGGSGPWDPPQPVVPTETTPRQDTEFDLLMNSLLPCRTNDPELWFAEHSDQVERAKALCRSCPLQAGCLAGALDRQEPWGVWGGEVFVDGAVVARKRGRGRPRKSEAVAA